jgi:ATP-dependent helicase/nuclease subunit B
MRTTVLIAPSMAAVVELPRRLAMAGNAVSGLYAFKLPDLARALAEPALLGRGLLAWDGGQDALLAARLLAEDPEGGFHIAADLPKGPVAATLARTLAELRRAGAPPESLETIARQGSAQKEDQDRLRTLGRLYRAFHGAREGKVADPNTILRAATETVAEAAWLRGAEVVVVEDVEAGPLERGLLAAIAGVAHVRVLARPLPAALMPSSFRAWASTVGIREARWEETRLAPLSPAVVPPSLERLRNALFELPEGTPVNDPAVEMITAPGEAAEARAIVRRLLRAARGGMPFEDMGVIVPRPEVYAPLFADLFARLGIPHRLHPSLPLRFGRAARSLLLLFRCRGLARSAVMEFLTFAPIPLAEMLGEDATPEPSRWDALSRDAGIVSGLDRWMIGLRAHAEAEREAAQLPSASPEQRERREQRATDADALLRVVELLSTTLDGLAGEATWAEWSAHLEDVCERWIGAEQDREAVIEVVADLAGLASVSPRAAWTDVERVIEARFEWERVPMTPPSTGGVHIGVLDAMAGLPFRLVVVPGLVEGGYPGVLRPDPFLLDPEREELARTSATPQPVAAALPGTPRVPAQLGLFDETLASSESPPPALPTTQDRLQQERRHFHRAVSQATEKLVLSYPRADPRSGRERLPSLFYVAAASALEGKAVTAADLDRLVVEEDLERLPLEDAVDRTERDRARVHREGKAAAGAIAAGSAFFKQSRLAARARWSGTLTRYDGLLTDLDPEALKKLDPLNAAFPISASRLATYSRCGFLYLLQYVLRLEPALEPEERKRLEPLERGSLFHEVAERFLRERREAGELPVRDTEEMRRRLLAMAEESLEALVAGSPPRFTFLWEREKERVRSGLLDWLRREAQNAARSTPAHFEVSFGLGRSATESEPHDPSPMLLDLGDGRTLRVSGQIDRIDERADRTLVLRDYKTGKAPKDEGGIFRGGKQLQIPFYILAAAQLFPGQPVVEAFLDYVDGGRQVAVDPDVVRSEGWKALLRGLVDSIGQGVFVQEPTACEWCDFTAVCGPRPLLERRRQIKRSDPQLIRVLRLRDLG